eukprot:scaffold30769_cov71-Phaeocystis_antarctica.AAC.4
MYPLKVEYSVPWKVRPCDATTCSTIPCMSEDSPGPPASRSERLKKGAICIRRDVQQLARSDLRSNCFREGFCTNGGARPERRHIAAPHMKRAESVVCPIRVLPLNLAKLLLTTTWPESFLAEHTHNGSSSANDGSVVLKSVSNEPFIAPVRFHVCDSDPAVELRCRPFHPVHVGVTAWVSRATGELDREMQEPGLFVGAVVTHRHASVTKRLVLRVRLPD